MGFTKDSLLSKTLASFDTKKSFFDEPIHQKAHKDFQYLCAKTNFMLKINFDNFIMHTQTETVCEIAVFGFNIGDKVLKFPKTLIKPEDPNQKIGVVCYENGNVKTVLVFDSSSFLKTGVFSKFKSYDRTDQFGLVLKKINNDIISEYSFGMVFRKYI